jgi:hypothetical protein
MTQADMWDRTNTNSITQLLNYAQGRIRIAGSYFAAPGGYTLDVTAGIDADVFDAIPNAQALAADFAHNQTPLRALIEGRAFSGVEADLTDLTTMTDNRVGIVTGGSLDDGSCGVGEYLGRLAAIPVQRKASRVKDGPLKPVTMYVGSAQVDTFSGLGVMHDKGYNVPRKFPNKVGYYWSGDHTCAADTDDYHFISRGRVIDKAQVLAYVTFVEELDDEITVNADGTLSQGLIKTLEAKIEGQINGSMTAGGEISAVKCFISPTQNVLSTNQTMVSLTITPVGYNGNIVVNLGFDNPALA